MKHPCNNIINLQKTNLNNIYTSTSAYNFRYAMNESTAPAVFGFAEVFGFADTKFHGLQKETQLSDYIIY